MSDHVEAHGARARRRRELLDRKMARAALHRAGGNPDIAAARLRHQALLAREAAVRRLFNGQRADSLGQRARRCDRAAQLLIDGIVRVARETEEGTGC